MDGWDIFLFQLLTMLKQRVFFHRVFLLRQKSCSLHFPFKQIGKKKVKTPGIFNTWAKSGPPRVLSLGPAKGFGKDVRIYGTDTLPKTDSLPLKIGHAKRKGSS